MRKFRLLLASATLLGLGVLATSNQAEVALNLAKIDVNYTVMAVAITFGLGIVAATSCGAVSLNYTEIKVDYSHTAKACVADGGTVVDKNGQAFCRLPRGRLRPPTGGPASLKVEMHEVLRSRRCFGQTARADPGQTTPSKPK